MIRHLSINNLLLIDKIEMDIGLGLCVLTGETGAGKSMILESLDLLSGRRVKPNIRPGSGKKTVITALIDVSSLREIKNILKKQEIYIEDEIIIKRVIESDGRSKALVNDSLVSLVTLREIANYAIEVHSQFSEQGLLDNSTHIKTLDEFGGYKNQLNDLSDAWKKYKDAEKNYLMQKSKLDEIQIKKDDFAFDLNELRTLDPKKGEFLALEQKKKILQNSRKINENINHVVENFNREDPPGIENLLSKNILILNKIRDLLDEETIKNIERLDSISLDISEISKSFESFINMEMESNSLENIDDRIALYRRLALKHSINKDELVEKMDDLAKNLESSEKNKQDLEKLSEKLEICKSQYLTKCNTISEIRKKNAVILDQKINQEFPDLKLENAEFKTTFQESQYSELGKDKIVFNIKTNPKAKMDEIRKISSGGELCRIALAIKVTAEKESLSTIVFDEVDSGIGGAVSTAVGERLRKLGKDRQVLVVTHSPQVASQGKNHFIVRKKLIENDISIKVDRVDHDGKIQEIARMLSGKEITNEAIQAAKKLIDNSI